MLSCSEVDEHTRTRKNSVVQLLDALSPVEPMVTQPTRLDDALSSS